MKGKSRERTQDRSRDQIISIDHILILYIPGSEHHAPCHGMPPSSTSHVHALAMGLTSKLTMETALGVGLDVGASGASDGGDVRADDGTSNGTNDGAGDMDVWLDVYK